MKVGYTDGVFDLFHIGHLNLLKNAKSECDKLIVGVITDEFVQTYKYKTPIIPLAERLEIVRSIKYVDEAVVIDDLDKIKLYHKYHYDVLFSGSDWQGHERWVKYEQELQKVGVSVIYLPYTKTTSSTLLTQVLNKITNG